MVRNLGESVWGSLSSEIGGNAFLHAREGGGGLSYPFMHVVIATDNLLCRRVKGNKGLSEGGVSLEV